MDDSDRRPSGAGTIEERGGKFRARVRWEGKRVDVGTYATRDEAERMIAAMLDDFESGRLSPPGSLTLREWGPRVLDERELSGLHRNVDAERSHWRAHIEQAPWIDDPVTSLTSQQIRRWAIASLRRKARQGRRAKGAMKVVELDRTVSRVTISRALQTLRSVLQAAIDEGIIDANPATGVRLPSAPRDVESWTYLTADEITLVLSHATIPEHERLIYATAIYTGLRRGELWGLRWGDVVLDDDRPHLVVRRSYRGATKAGRVQPVPLIAIAHATLARWHAITPYQTTPDRLVFPLRIDRDDGTEIMRGAHDTAHWRGVYTRGHWYPGNRELAGIERRVRFHDFRHTCASHLLMGTWGEQWRLEDVREMLRHSSVTMTERYAHLAADAIHAIAARTPGPTVAPSAAERATQAGETTGGPWKTRTSSQRIKSAGERGRSAADAERGGRPGAGLAERAAALLGRIEGGALIAREEVDAIAALALADQVTSAALAVLEAGDDVVLARAAELVEAVLRRSCAVQAGAREA